MTLESLSRLPAPWIVSLRTALLLFQFHHTIADRAVSVENSSALLLPGLHRSTYDLAVQLVQAATRHVPDKFLPALALVLELEEHSQLLLLVALLLFVAPDLLLLLRITIANVIGMVSDAMEVSQQDPLAPLLPLGIAQIHKRASAMNKERQLPFPGSLGPDGTRDIWYLTL